MRAKEEEWEAVRERMHREIKILRRQNTESLSLKIDAGEGTGNHNRPTTTKLYYYSSPVRQNLSSKFDVFLARRSKFDSDHRVDLYAHTCCQSATSGPLFAFYCPLFFTGKNS